MSTPTAQADGPRPPKPSPSLPLGRMGIPRLSGDQVASLGPLFALIVACIFFSALTPNFLTSGNFSLIIQQVMVVGVLAIGQTLIIITAGIDLSCGTVMAFGSIIMTKLAVENGVPPILAILIGIAACAGFGLLNGALVVKFNLPPFIVTLGTFSIALAATQIYSQQATITNLPPEMTFFGETFDLGGTAVTYGSIVALGLFGIAWFVLSQTAWGRRTYAIGDNPEAARLMGIHVKSHLLSIYIIAGAIYGIAALLLVARTGVGDPNAGITDNLTTITAVVLGGTSLFGGRGVIIGTLIGAMIIGVVRNGLILIGVSSQYQILITGILVILAVSVDQLARKRA